MFLSLLKSRIIPYISVHNISLSGDLDDDLQAWSTFFPSYENILVGGDINVQLISLGYTRENNRTNELSEHLSTNNMIILNDPDAPASFVQRDRSGRPDLTLGGMNILDSIENWKVDTDSFSFSDHRYITNSLNFEPLISKNYRYKTKNKSFKTFNKLIKSNLHTYMRYLLRVNSYIDLDIWIDSFENSDQYELTILQ